MREQLRQDAEDVDGFILAFDSLTQQALGQGESAEPIREFVQVKE